MTSRKGCVRGCCRRVTVFEWATRNTRGYERTPPYAGVRQYLCLRARRRLRNNEQSKEQHAWAATPRRALLRGDLPLIRLFLRRFCTHQRPGTLKTSCRSPESTRGSNSWQPEIGDPNAPLAVEPCRTRRPRECHYFSLAQVRQ